MWPFNKKQEEPVKTEYLDKTPAPPAKTEEQEATWEIVMNQQNLIKGLNFGLEALQMERDNLQSLMAGLMIDQGLTEFTIKKEVFENNLNDGVEIIYDFQKDDTVKVFMQIGGDCDECEGCEHCNG